MPIARTIRLQHVLRWGCLLAVWSCVALGTAHAQPASADQVPGTTTPSPLVQPGLVVPGASATQLPGGRAPSLDNVRGEVAPIGAVLVLVAAQ